MRFLERTLKVAITEMEVPTLTDIARLRLGRLAKQLRDTLADNELTAERTWLEDLVKEGEHDIGDFAAAAMHLIGEAQGTSFEDEPFGPDPLAPTRPRRSRESPAHIDDANMVELFFPIGRNQGVRPGDLVGAVANEANVSSEFFGKITVLDRKSFMAVPEPIAEQVLAALDRIQIRGVEVPVDRARPRRPHPGSRQPPRRHEGRGRAGRSQGHKTWPKRKGKGKGTKPKGKKASRGR